MLRWFPSLNVLLLFVLLYPPPLWYWGVPQTIHRQNRDNLPVANRHTRTCR